MSAHEQLVGEFSRRLGLWLFVRQAVAAATVWSFLWGTAILILKSTQGIDGPVLLWGAAGFPAAIGLAAWAARRRMPDRSAVRALLDHRGDYGGLLMAGAECRLGDWADTMNGAAAPRLEWRGRRPLGFLTVAVVYVVLGFVVPAASLAVAETPLDIDRPAEQLASQVRVLQEEKILDAERVENLKEKIDELRSQSSGKNPAKTLEALDHLKDVVRQAARKAAENAARQANQLAKVELAAQALQKVDSKTAAGLMKELNALVKNALAENGQLSEELGKELAEAMKDGKLSAEQLEKLAAAARGGKDSIAKTARRLFDSKLIDDKQLKACENGGGSGDGGAGDAEALAKYLQEHAGEKTLEEGLQEQLGKGGVDDDGPGITPLQFGDKSSGEGVKFRATILPPAALSSLKDSRLLGVSAAPPQRDKTGGPPQAGGLKGAAAGGGSANAAPVLPQHKAAVGRYFDRPMK